MRFLNTNKKKNFLVFFFAFFVVGSGLFLFADVQPVSAKECYDSFGKYMDCLTFGNGTAVIDAAIDTVSYPFKLALLGIFIVLGWMASAALTLFEWVVKPENIAGPTGVLNLPGIYEMWKFVRDFFNIFFIFGLLYIAFTTVFQIQKNFKKAILTLVLAALFVNFSYPITRVLIDATNVPMYFFLNQMMGVDGNTTLFSTTLSASKLEEVLIPQAMSTSAVSFERYFVAIIFMFLYAVTLLVLAIMFVIRLIALMILLVFASVGFVAMIIPGLEQYSKMWWDNFWKYALFGPAAALMVLVAVRFLDTIGNPNTGVFKGLKSVATDKSVEPAFIAGMAMVAFPIIVLWFAIGLGQKMGLAGAATISGKGEKFAKWVGKKTYDNPLGRGLGGGIRQRAENNKVLQVLTPKFWKGPSSTEAAIKGGIVGAGTTRGVRGGARSELDKIRYKKASDDAEEYKKNRMAHSEAREKMAKGDAGAALYLAGDKGLSSAEDLVAATKITGHDRDMLAKVMNGAQDSAVGDLTDKQHAAIQGSFYARDPKTGTVLRDAKDPSERGIDSTKQEAYAAYTIKLKKEGKLDVRVNHEIQARIDDVKGTSRETARDAVYAKRIATLDAEDLIKQTDLHKGTTGADLMAYYEGAIDRGEVSAQRIQKTIDKAVEKGKPEVQKVWLTLGGSVSKKGGKSPTPREIAEEEFAKATKKP